VQALLGQLDHRFVEIERRHGGGTQSVENHFGADAAAAPNFQDVLRRERAAGQAPEPGRLSMMLMSGTQGIVHRRTLDGIEFHAVYYTPVGYLLEAIDLGFMDSSSND
jgi:hypothetical protein